MSSVESRLSALVDALQRRQLLQELPIDPLSASLYSLKNELAALDEEGKKELLKEMNCPDDGESDSLRLSADDINRFIESIVKG